MSQVDARPSRLDQAVAPFVLGVLFGVLVLVPVATWALERAMPVRTMELQHELMLCPERLLKCSRDEALGTLQKGVLIGVDNKGFGVMHFQAEGGFGADALKEPTPDAKRGSRLGDERR